ncbi:hypothetical protein VTK56DRAFT_2402 [Thermocarpiscus australiensis]
MATAGSLVYNSPPMSGVGTKVGSSPIMSPEAGSSRQSPQPASSGKEHTTFPSSSSAEKDSPPTKASSPCDSPPDLTYSKPTEAGPGGPKRQPPAVPPRSSGRGVRNTTGVTTPNHKQENLGLALQLETINPAFLHPTTTSAAGPLVDNPKTSPLLHHHHHHQQQQQWTVPDSPAERLSQRRATPDSAYDRARQMELRRSEWKRAVYRFPVRGRGHWAIDADLTESSHARLAEVARRSSEGFKWNGDYELANVYRVLAEAHGRLVEEMRAGRRAGGGREAGRH